MFRNIGRILNYLKNAQRFKKTTMMLMIGFALIIASIPTMFFRNRNKNQNYAITIIVDLPPENENEIEIVDDFFDLPVLIPIHEGVGIFYNAESSKIILPTDIKVISQERNHLHTLYTVTLEGAELPWSIVHMLGYSQRIGLISHKGDTLTIRAFQTSLLKYGQTTYYNYLQIIDPREHYHTIIIIDPGHGGHDPGAPSALGDEYPNEASINLAIALKLLELYDTSGVLLLPTRTTDTFVPIRYRDRLANAAGDYFISIHANGDTNRLSQGTLTLYGSAEGSRELAQAFQSELVIALESRDRGVLYSPGHRILRESNIPVALLEILFMSNPDEAARLANPETQMLIARTIAYVIDTLLV